MLPLDTPAAINALGAAEAVRVDIVVAMGRRMRSLLEASLPAGAHSIVWDGRNDRGDAAPSGVYFYQVTADTGSMTRRVVRVRE